MRLAQIALRNFRSGQNLVLDTSAPRVYICGRNGAGKSSIKEAIRWTLRGVCSATDAKGLGWEALMPDGTMTLSAGVVLQGIGGVERTYRAETNKRTLQLEGRDNDISSTQNAIYQLLDTTPEFLDAVLETSYFLDLHHAEAKAMVLGLLNVQISVGEERLSLAQVEGRYKTAFQDRATAKQRAKDFRVPSFEVPTEGLLPKPEDVQKRLGELRKELEGLVGQAGESSGRRQALEEQLRVAQALPVYQEVPAPSLASIKFLQDEVSRMEAEADRISKLAKPPVKQQTVAKTSSEIEDRIKILTDHKPTKGCVLDNGVPCETAKIVFTNRVKFYKNQQEQAAFEAAPDPEAPPVPVFDHAALVDTRAQLKALEAQHANYNLVIKSNKERTEEIDGLTAQLASLGPAAAAVKTTEIEALQARITKGETVLTRSQSFWRQHDDHAAAVEKKTALDADVARLEALCEVLGPNGARVEALKNAIGAFEGSINATTRPFGWIVTFELEPWTVLVNGRRIVTYSESEQFRIGIAIQLAVAVASRLGFLVVDRLDMLDKPNRALVTQMLLDETPGIEQVVILATRDEDQKLPNIENVRAYRLGTQGKSTFVQEANTIATLAGASA